MNLPEIAIKDGWLLRENVSVHLNELWGNGKPMASSEDMEKYVAAYRAAWKEKEKVILKGMCETFGLGFRHNIIDVYIAPWFAGISEPMIIGIQNKPDRFVDVLTHELLHRLLTNNTTYHATTNLRETWEKYFGAEHTFKTLVHIPVHAGLKAIYLDVLKESERLQRDIEYHKAHKDYDVAWQYVNQYDYKKVIQTLKSGYASIK